MPTITVECHCGSRSEEDAALFTSGKLITCCECGDEVEPDREQLATLMSGGAVAVLRLVSAVPRSWMT